MWISILLVSGRSSMNLDVVLTWIIIGLIGVVMYSAPNYILNMLKEGFATVVGKGTLTPDQIDQMRSILGSPYFEEDSKGGRSQPEGTFGSTESKSSDANIENIYSPSRNQGISYRKMTDPGEPSGENLKTQDNCLPEPIPDDSPKCPDLKDYIRKDRIPCWGCKL